MHARRAVMAALAGILLGVAQPGLSQVQRSFPANALRGSLTFGTPPTVLLNGQSAQLAPGARIRGENNLLLMSGALAGQSHTSHYTLDPLGLLMDVWLLRDEEKQRFWPRSLEEAGQYEFDAAAQAWTRRDAAAK